MANTKPFKPVHPIFHRNGSSSGGFTKREKIALELMKTVIGGQPAESPDLNEASELAVGGANLLIDKPNK